MVILMNIVPPNETILIQVPAPRENMLGFTRNSYGRAVFRRCLEDYCREHEVGDQTQASLHECQQLQWEFRRMGLT